MGNEIIELSNIRKSYWTGKTEFPALRDLSLTVEKGEMVSVMGASGSGKTTLLNILGLIDRFDSGRYLFLGKDVSRLRDSEAAALRNQEIGFVFQDFCLIPDENALYNVKVPLYFDKTPRKQMKEKALSALRRTGLPEEQFHKPVKYLSGGQKQRVAIARAIVQAPSLLLADEPSGALDSESMAGIMALFRELNETGITVVVVTHDKTVSGFCGREIRIRDGKAE